MSELRTLIDSAYNTAKLGYYKDALEEFLLILNHDPSQKDSLYGAAACAFRLNQTDLAEDFIDRLLKRFPNDPQALELRQRIDATGFAQADEKSKDIIQRLREQTEDPFGVGSDKKLTDVIPEWRTLDVSPPNFWTLIASGKKSRPGRLRILAAYSEAGRLYRAGGKRLIAAGWVALLALLVFIGFTVAAMAGLIQSFQYMKAIGEALALLLGYFLLGLFYPLLGIHTYFCYRWKRDPATPGLSQFGYVEKYPHILAGTLWTLLPALVLYGFLGMGALNLPQSAEAFLPPKNANDAIVFGALFAQFYLFLRCWFINLVLIDRELRPLEAASRAYHLTGGQRIRFLVFVTIQILLLPIAILPLGIGFPFLCLAQVAAFDQLNNEEPLTGGSAGKGG